jgi:hypothetical protein
MKERKYDQVCEELGIDPAMVKQHVAAVASKGMSTPDTEPPVQPHYSTGVPGQPGPGSMDVKIAICGCSGKLSIESGEMKVELPAHITHALGAFFSQHTASPQGEV